MLDFFVVPDIEDIIHSSIKPNPIARTFKTCLKVLGSSAGSPRCGYRRAHRRLRFSRGRHRTRGIAYRLRVGVRRWKCRGSTYRLRLLDFVGEFRLCYTNGAEAGRIVFFFCLCLHRCRTPSWVFVVRKSKLQKTIRFPPSTVVDARLLFASSRTGTRFRRTSSGPTPLWTPCRPSRLPYISFSVIFSKIPLLYQLVSLILKRLPLGICSIFHSHSVKNSKN